LHKNRDYKIGVCGGNSVLINILIREFTSLSQAVEAY